MKINMHGYTGEILFIWDMTEIEFRDLFAPLPDNMYDLTEYDGAVFFGNFKLEFMKNDIVGGYRNLFQYGAEDAPDKAYSYLEDGTPYEERYVPGETITLPHRHTFQKFAEDIENQIISLLDKYPEYIPDALVPTVPDKWYPCDNPYRPEHFTRKA